MKKSDEISDPNSCLNKATDDELVFVLRGHDITAPAVIRAWVNERIVRGKNKPNDNVLCDAENIATGMELQRGGGERYKQLAIYDNYRWRPIAELCEDYGNVLAININDEEITPTLVHVCNKDFDESLWTHFSRITPLTLDQVECMRKEMEYEASGVDPDYERLMTS